jgi:hypothetical protein
VAAADEVEQESLKDEIANLIEEARMVLPGIQALFGFQLIAVFNDGFRDLEPALAIHSPRRHFTGDRGDRIDHDTRCLSPHCRTRCSVAALFRAWFDVDRRGDDSVCSWDVARSHADHARGH